MSKYNERMITEFRANSGIVTTGYGSSLVLVHSIGARSGEARIHPLVGFPDGDGWLIVASKGGAPENPAWYYNLRAHPDTEIEVPAGDHVATVAVHAEEVSDAEYPEVWARFESRSRAFEQYAEKTTRRIPVIRLNPR